MSQPSILRWLLNFALPDPCLGCGVPRDERGRTGGMGDLGLCARCETRLAAPHEPACPTCGRPSGPAGSADLACGECRRRPPAFDLLVAGFVYRSPADAVIRGLKFGALEYLGAALADRLVARAAPHRADLDLVVPVPLHWARRLRRGYNQAERIATPLARALGLPIAACLYRRRLTPPQTSLERGPRERSQRRSFAVRNVPALAGRSLLLVDDVTTTGATLRAASATLLRAGARRVVALAAARTPGADEEPREVANAAVETATASRRSASGCG